MNPTAELVAELNHLIRMTAAEATIARSRVVQARDDDVRAELTANARNAERRGDRLARAVRDLGGVPDRLGAVVATGGTLVRTQLLDQAAPVTEALLADLALEHQLRDRAAFARVLADTVDEPRIAALLEEIEAAHGETIDWIGTRLGEVALGGPAALQPTPMQAVAGVGRSVALVPQRVATAGANRAMELAGRVADGVGARLGRTRELAEAAEETLVAGRDAVLRAGEEQAAAQGAGRAVRAIHEARSRAGALSVEELAVPRYDSLNVTQASTRVRRLDDADDVRAVLAYEEANKARQRVIDAARGRLTELAEQAVTG
jgi:bacterioferritin (cytochrome b1)